MNIEQIRAAIAYITDAMRALVYEADGTSLRADMSTEDEARFAEGEAEVARLEALLARHEHLAEMAERGSASNTRSGNVAPFSHNRNDDPFDLSDLRYGASLSEVRGRAHTALERVRHLPDAQRGHVAEMIDRHPEVIGRVLATGTEEYRSAFMRVATGESHLLNEGERAALQRSQSLTDAAGGYAIPFTLDSTILLTNDGVISAIRRIARTTTISTDTWNGVSSAGASATYKAENAEMTDDAITLAQPSVPVHRMDIFIPYSFEIGGDWPGFESDMRMVMNDAKGRREAAAFVTGTGTNQPTGFLTAMAAAHAGSGPTYVTPATAETFAIADVYTMETELPPRFRANAQWLAEKSTYNAIRQFGTSDGHALWERVGAGLPPELLGYAANEDSSMEAYSDVDAAATDTTNRILAFGDWSRFLVVDRVGMNFEMVPHLFHTDNNRPNGQRALLAWCRNGSDVLTDGAFRVLNIATTA